jgi:hypothetical protein
MLLALQVAGNGDDVQGNHQHHLLPCSSNSVVILAISGPAIIQHLSAPGFMHHKIFRLELCCSIWVFFSKRCHVTNV